MFNRYTYSPSTKLSHYDLLSTLHQLIKSISLSWKLFHLKGHQDGDDTYNRMYEWVQMNIEVDRIAKYYPWRQIHVGDTHPPHEAIR